LWITRNGDDRIDRVAGDGAQRSVELPAGTGPYGITTGPDGAIWFTALGAGAIGRLTVDGALTMIPVPGGGSPAMITSGPDGALWFTVNNAGAIGRIERAGGGVILHRLSDGGCGPVGIGGDDWGIWFTEINAGRVGRVTPPSDLEEFDLPDRTARPHGVAPDGIGGCWVSLWAGNAIVHLDRHGAIAEQYAFDEGDEPHGVAVGPDGAVVVALESGYVVTLRPTRPSSTR
jgi:virginiamycin B lyase